MEAVVAGVARLTGTSYEGIYNGIHELLEDTESYQQMAKSSNVFGDGKTAEYIVEYVRGFLDDKSNSQFI